MVFIPWVIFFINALSLVIGKERSLSTRNPLHEVNSSDFKALAESTYLTVAPCIRSTWLMQGKNIQFRFPNDAQTHYEDLIKKTAKFRTAHIHGYGEYHGPWIENLYISRFQHLPLYTFRGLIPLFIQWVDIQILGSDKFEEIHQALETLLRPDVLYVTVSQSDIGLGKITKSLPNILVFSAGGFGHSVIPLVKGEMKPVPLPEKFDVELGFYGTNHESRGNRPVILKAVVAAANEVQLSYRIRSGQ